jgi:hypothetical protein
MMAAHADRTITIQLHGPSSERGELRLDDFLDELQRVKAALRETERLVSGRAPSLYFRIKKLQKNSPASVTLEAASDAQDERAEPQFASYVVRSLSTNLRLISHKKRLPKKIDVPVLETYRELVAPSEKRQIDVQIQVGNHSVLINRKFRDILDEAIGEDEFSYGSLSGTIEAINLHDKRRFWLYPTVGPARVIGKFRNKDRKRFAAAVDKYVTVFGRLRYKTWDMYPYAIFADDIQIHDDKAPTLYDMKGMSPDATGTLTTQEYIDHIRDEW